MEINKRNNGGLGRKMDDTITIVSGLPRSGTSMMMKITIMQVSIHLKLKT